MTAVRKFAMGTSAYKIIEEELKALGHNVRFTEGKTGKPWQVQFNKKGKYIKGTWKEVSAIVDQKRKERGLEPLTLT